MNSVKSERDPTRLRRQLVNSIKESLRELNLQLSVLAHQVGTRLDLRDVDLDCLDLLNLYGPQSPSALAARTGLHPATMTGILDRLERGGWVVRERDAHDRRAVLVRAVRDRTAEVFRLYAGMNSELDGILAEYADAELETVADFLGRAIGAGDTATKQLAGE